MAQAVARTSSRFWYSSPVSRALATTSVGARPSFEASFAAPAATSFANVSGPSTRKRHGSVRWWFGAKRASSKQRLDRLAVDRLGLEGLVCPP